MVVVMTDAGAWHHSLTDKTGQTEPLKAETPSTVGSQSDSATHWLEMIPARLHGDRHKALGGEVWQ